MQEVGSLGPRVCCGISLSLVEEAVHLSVRGNGEEGPSAHGAGHEDSGTELMGGRRQASEQRTHKSRPTETAFWRGFRTELSQGSTKGFNKETLKPNPST